jgi:predicted DNA-binding protein (UPF0251 family)
MEWHHQREEEHRLDDYEKNFKKYEDVKMVNGVERIEMLTFDWRASLEDITHACEETEIIRRQRIETLTQSRSSERMEVMMENAKRTLKKVSLKKLLKANKKQKMIN